MNTDTAARVFAELGNRKRLDILRVLIKAGERGLAIGDIRARLKIPLSTLAFHLRGLVGTGLVVQRKEGRMVMCCARFDRINGAVAYLKENCCAGFEDLESERGSAA